MKGPTVQQFFIMFAFMPELFPHQPVPGGFGIGAEMAKGGFRIPSGMGLQFRSVCVERNRAVRV